MRRQGNFLSLVLHVKEDTCHVFVEVGKLLDLLLDWWVAVGVLRDVKLINLCL